jgi:hypothetical protein
MSKEQQELEFETTGNAGQDQAKLEEVARKGDSSRLNLVQQNRKAGLEGLQRAHESLENSIEKLQMDGCVIDANGEVFNLKVALREALRGIQNAHTCIEASQSLEDMLVHDLSGVIKNLEQVAAANWQSGAHSQVLIEVLKEKEIITEDDLRNKWNQLIPDAVAKMREDAKKS